MGTYLGSGRAALGEIDASGINGSSAMRSEDETSIDQSFPSDIEVVVAIVESEVVVLD